MRRLAGRAAPLLAVVRRLPAEGRIYSNMPDAIRFLTGRDAIGLPRWISPTSRRRNPRFGAELDAIAHAAAGSPVHIVFITDHDRWFVASERDVASRIPVARVAALPSGVIAVVRSHAARAAVAAGGGGRGGHTRGPLGDMLPYRAGE
jgi:hypothetical protein